MTSSPPVIDTAAPDAEAAETTQQQPEPGGDFVSAAGEGAHGPAGARQPRARSLRSKPVDLAALARAAFAQCQERNPGRGVELDGADSLPATGDPRLLAQVFENLIGNSWKFTCGARRPRIAVGSIEGPGGGAVYSARANGAGFDMNYAGKLFEPFGRLHSQDEFEGTGIGLAIVNRVVARHGGRPAHHTFPLEPSGSCPDLSFTPCSELSLTYSERRS